MSRDDHFRSAGATPDAIPRYGRYGFYRQQAAECVEHAKSAPTQTAKGILMEMAASWLKLAALAEALAEDAAANAAADRPRRAEQRQTPPSLSSRF